MMQLPEGGTSAAVPRFVRLCGWALYLLAAPALWRIVSLHMVSRPDEIRVLITAIGAGVVVLLGWIGTLLHNGRRTGVFWLFGFAVFQALGMAVASQSGKHGTLLIVLATLTTGAAIWSLTYWKSLR